jgi:hypothetical protein
MPDVIMTARSSPLPDSSPEAVNNIEGNMEVRSFDIAPQTP